MKMAFLSSASWLVKPLCGAYQRKRSRRPMEAARRADPPPHCGKRGDGPPPADDKEEEEEEAGDGKRDPRISE